MQQVTENNSKDKAMPEQASEPNYCIALQPICNANMRHVADELLYRSSATATFARVEDQLMATARVVNAAFFETGLEKLIGNRKLFFNAPREWILKPELLPPNPDQVVVEVLESVTGEPEILAALKKVRRLGYDVALDDFILNDATRPLLDVASIIKVDLFEPVRDEDIQEYCDRGIRLLAEKVEDLDTFKRFKEMGFELFQGYFYARPEVHAETSRKGRGNNRSAQIRILSELQKEEPDYRILEMLIAQDPQLTFMLLKYVNSALFRRANEITTIHQALNTLGLERVRSIVTTVMLANNGPASRLLLPQALTRAQMCEKLAYGMSQLDPRSAFMMGLMSMMDVLMGMEMQPLMEQLPLSSEIKGAILRREGRLGQLLNLVLAFEHARMGSKSPDLVARLNQAWLESQTWSNEVMSQVEY
ncbi:EAL and HDOD domain-containing protein [Marinospirillum alkaliphilum]|uniref:EAL and modified HD-GYP domain-containing signal transduction protein n=1 Tax=Marinospirillum alkaliphilum DSM 21637 TaxID=1122209 RepID=A0A1K1UF16_9GAMM|nr:HDOD domain-containing protein [Marinospirillum alkaliphilum]SFX11657.1 EAL and modified HD-GYP domain-containing signal transduction protein [Marinospirillum alkaliphilum DSM 21637]